MHDNNAQPNRMHLVDDYHVSKGIRGLRHSPYNSDPIPCDFWLFSLLMRALCGVRFATDAEVRTSVQKNLKEIPVKEFKTIMMKKWQERMHQHPAEWEIFQESVGKR